MGVLDNMPKVPRMEKFCFCMEVKTGVRAFSSVLSVLWVIYFVLAFLGGGDWMWVLGVGLVNILAYSAVLTGMMKDKKIMLLPALVVSTFDIVAGILQCIVGFFLLQWLGVIWVAMMTTLTAYYVVGLKNVYNDMSWSPVKAEPSTDTKPPVNPV